MSGTRPVGPMRECLRPRKGPPALVLQCFRCGLTKEIEDDGRRVAHAWAHASACAQAPEGGGPPQLQLKSSSSLEMRTEDQELWFQIKTA